MPDQAPNIDIKPGDSGKLVYDKERRAIVHTVPRMSLPQTSDALRHEAIIIQDAARRAAECMAASIEPVREAHARILTLEAEVARLNKLIKDYQIR